MVRLASPLPLVPLSYSTSNTNHVMEDIEQKLRKIKDGRDNSTTVKQYLGLCLRTSARKGRADIFRRLLPMEGLDVNDTDVKGITAMMYACQNGSDEIVKIMLENHKFDPTLRDQNNNGLLNFAVKNQKLPIVNLLLADRRVSSSINIGNNAGSTPLILACDDGDLEMVEKLLSLQNVDINAADNNGDSPLLHAVIGGLHDIVSKLLENPKIEVNKPNGNGDTSLMCAANEGFSNIVESLLQRKDIDVNMSNVDGFTSLMCASDKGFEGIVKSLLSHPDIDINREVKILIPEFMTLSFSLLSVQDAGGDSALVWAVDKNHSRVVNMLLDRQDLEPSQKHVAVVTCHLTQTGLPNLSDVCFAIINALENNRPKVGLWLLQQRIMRIEEAGTFSKHIENILILAVRMGAVTIVDYLVKHSGVDVNILDNSEPLLVVAADRRHQPSTRGYVDIVRSLISRSCDVNRKGSLGNTALARACDRGNHAIVAVLLSHPEIDVNTVGEEDLTPLLCAARGGHKAVVDLLLERKEIKVNLRGSADIQEIRGKSALIWAGEMGHRDIVKRLVEHPDVEINMKDEDGYTGLIWAADNGHLDALTEFLEHPKIDVNAVDLDGHSALTWAADRGHTSIVQLLLEHKDLDVNVRDFEGFSPLICAANQGHRSVVKL